MTITFTANDNSTVTLNVSDAVLDTTTKLLTLVVDISNYPKVEVK